MDNASTDGSAEKAVMQFPEIQLIRSEENQGFGAGSNLGAANAKGEYLAFLNPDTETSPGWLHPLIQALESNSMIGLATPKILMNDDSRTINTCGNEIHISGITLCRGFGREIYEFDTSEEVGAVSGAAFVIRKELFESLGGFDEDFFLYMEDTDLSVRARLLGYLSLYIPSSVIYHNYSLKLVARKIYFQERNRYLNLLKCFKWGTLFVLLPILLLAEVVTWGYSILRDKDNLMNKIHAYLWVLKHLNIIMDKRQKIQTMRSARDRDLLLIRHPRLDFEQTGDGILSKMAHFVFDPLFNLSKQAVLMFVWW